MNRYYAAMIGTLGIISLLLPACSVLPKAAPVSVERYTLDVEFPSALPAAPEGPVLLIARPLARTELDTPRMAYREQDHTVEYFARSRWADTPALLLQPGLVEAFEASGHYRAVIRVGSAAAALLRLDTEVLEFSHDFRVNPSQFEIRLRIQLVDLQTRKVIASRIFTATQPAPVRSPYGGAQAANAAWQSLLPEIVTYCTAQLPARP